MNVGKVNFRIRSIGAAVALLLAGTSLSGCVVYPSGYGYNYGGGYAPAYYAAPVYGSFYFGGGYGHRWR